MKRRRFLALTGIGLAFWPAAAARADEITFFFAPDVTETMRTAVRAAAARWSANLDLPAMSVTVSLDNNMALDTLALTTTDTFSYDYDTIRSWLSTNATSADDLAAVANLQTGGSVQMLLNRTANPPSPLMPGSATPYLDNDGDYNNVYINSTLANMRVLGDYFASGRAGRIAINPRQSWDYDPGNGISKSAYDFVGIMTHELGHVLGFTSGVDELDYAAAAGDLQGDDELQYVTIMDLFRYSDQSAGQGAIDWTADQRDKYFSIDGGQTAIGQFSTGENFGDGSQNCHWVDAPASGIMAPMFSKGQLLSIDSTDRRMFDVLGYTLKQSFQWTRTGNGNWSDTTAWNAAMAPDGGIEAVFATGAAHAIGLTAPTAAWGLRISSSNVTLNLGTHGLTLAGDLVIADSAAAAMVVNGSSGLAAHSAYVGGSDIAAGGAGTLTINPGVAASIQHTLRIWSSAGSAVHLAGGSLTAFRVINGGTFDHSTGDLAITETFTNEVGAAATFAGTQQWGSAARLIASGGSVSFNSDSGGAASRNLAIEADPGAEIAFNATQHLRSLSMAGGHASLAAGPSGVLVADSISLSAEATLDLGQGRMIIEDSAIGIDDYREIGQWIRNARSAGWAGPGLTSGDLVGTSSRTLAAIWNDDGLGNPLLSGFADHAVGADAILIGSTWDGDANLDGAVGTLDFAALSKGYVAGQLARTDGIPFEGTFNVGDFNYDGLIDTGDFALLSKGYVAYQLERAAGSMTSAAIAVPEPGMLCSLTFAGIGLLWRRRHRQTMALRSS